MGLSKGANNTTEANTTVETTTYGPLTTNLSTPLANTTTEVNTTAEVTTSSEPLTGGGWSTPPTQPGNTTTEVNTTAEVTTSNPFVGWPIPPTAPTPTTPPIPNSGPGVLAMLRIVVRSTVDLSRDSSELSVLLQEIKDLISLAATNITVKSIQKVPIL
ncbi:hypothetical protein IRJ41_008660 [Triplophysa rosa]|uniref:Uncharacterized protein n=1 Tax=Triplophysa rosa TaxID=992332 RepID=A0A9W8C7P6_TRIRA|nr:hypothetical protein IRJ41_008660 [Triplophysa rosa]